MILSILSFIIGSIIFLIYFLSGVFYIIKKPQIIVNKKLNKIRKVYNITNVNDYLNNLGKLKVYSSIILYLGLITAVYADIYKYLVPMYVYIIFYFIYFYICRGKLEKNMKKYLVGKNTQTINE